MKKRGLTKALPLLIGIILCVAGAILLPAASPEAKRGDFPQCQEECFRRHSQHMVRLLEDGKHTPNVLQFQDQVDKEVAEYQTCLNGCRELMPVK
jgi:hypothetical protein